MTEHTSLETSLALWDAGFRGEHAHVIEDRKWCAEGEKIYDKYRLSDDWVNPEKAIPCYTFTELWGALPPSIQQGRHAYGPVIDKAINGSTYASYSRSGPTGGISPLFNHESPVEAIAALLLWAIKEGHVTWG